MLKPRKIYARYWENTGYPWGQTGTPFWADRVLPPKVGDKGPSISTAQTCIRARHVDNNDNEYS